MQHADIEFVRFSSADVIATSGFQQLWVAGNVLHSIQDTDGRTTFSGYYTALLNGTTPPETDTLYRIIPESSDLRPGKQNEYYTLDLQGTTEGTVREGTDLVLDGYLTTPTTAVQSILLYLILYRRQFDQ